MVQHPLEAIPKIQALLSEGISCPIVVTGKSMMPFLHEKEDTVIVAPVTESVRRGDILLYLRGVKTAFSDVPADGAGVSSSCTACTA